MGYKRTSKAVDREQRLQDAISVFRNKEFNSVRAAANAFDISDRTLSRYLAGGLSRAEATEIT